MRLTYVERHAGRRPRVTSSIVVCAAVGDTGTGNDFVAETTGFPADFNRSPIEIIPRAVLFLLSFRLRNPDLQEICSERNCVLICAKLYQYVVLSVCRFFSLSLRDFLAVRGNTATAVQNFSRRA